MYYLIGADGREYGPVDAETVKNWISRNLANQQSKVRRAGVEPPEWKALGEFAEFAGSEPQTLPPPLPVETPPFDSSSPAPKVAGNLHQAIPVNVDECIAEALRTAKPIRIFDCIERGWGLAMTNYWPMIGTAALVTLCLLAVSMVPYVGGLIQMVMQGMFMGGLIYYFLGKKRGKPRRLEDAFSGFRRMTLNLFLANLLIGLLSILATIPGLIIVGISVAFLGLEPEMKNFSFSTLEPLAIAGCVIGILIASAAVIYFTIGWLFTLNLVVDKRIGFWEAMKISRAVVNKQWWRLFGLQCMCGLIAFGGMLSCCVGYFFVLPVIQASNVYAYDDLFSGIKTGAEEE